MTGNEKALVVLSGGQDSTTCLYWAINRFGQNNVSCITFDYGQRHRVELECARKVAEYAGVPNEQLPIDTFAALGGNALTESNIDVTSDGSAENGLPNTFVPGRNLIFLSFAAAYAYQRNIQHLVTGVAQTDYSGYPDCRPDFNQAFAEAVKLGTDDKVAIEFPFAKLDKRDIGDRGRELEVDFNTTWTCYKGEKIHCGVCGACDERKYALRNDQGLDPTKYQE